MDEGGNDGAVEVKDTPLVQYRHCSELLAAKFPLCTEYLYLTLQPIRGQVIHKFSGVEKS